MPPSSPVASTPSTRPYASSSPTPRRVGQWGRTSNAEPEAAWLPLSGALASGEICEPRALGAVAGVAGVPRTRFPGAAIGEPADLEPPGVESTPYYLGADERPIKREVDRLELRPLECRAKQPRGSGGGAGA
eukprot:1958453-Prymnesium_polylepis.1